MNKYLLFLNKRLLYMAAEAQHEANPEKAQPKTEYVDNRFDKAERAEWNAQTKVINEFVDSELMRITDGHPEKLSPEERELQSNKAKETLQQWSDTAKMLESNYFPGAKIFPCKEDSTVGQYLNRPMLSLALHADQGKSVENLFPELRDMPVKRGEFIVISPDKKNVKVVNIKDFTSLDFSNDAYAVTGEGSRDEEMYAEVKPAKEKFIMVGDKVHFESKRADLSTTLGDMFSDQYLVVNGKLAVKGVDGEYHRVRVLANGAYDLSRGRIIVREGSTVAKNTEKYQKVIAKLEKREGGSTNA